DPLQNPPTLPGDRSGSPIRLSPGQSTRPTRLRTGLPALRPILEALDAGLLCAVGATVVGAALFDAVADDLAATVGAGGGQCVDGALEGVEGVRAAGRRHVERLVVVVATHVAFRHGCLPVSRAFRVRPLNAGVRFLFR